MKDKNKLDLNNMQIQEGMVCGPEGCSLVDHFDWAKDKSTKDKK